MSELSGASVSYYKVHISDPVSGMPSYQAHCIDIIEALGMSFAEGEAFKALWRHCAARTLKKKKRGIPKTYDAEKIVFYSSRILVQARRKD